MWQTWCKKSAFLILYDKISLWFYRVISCLLWLIREDRAALRMSGLGLSIPVPMLGLTGIAELGKMFELERRAGPGPDVREAPELWRARLPQG